MSIIDSWYCPQCGNHNVVGGIIAECFMCQTPRPAPTMRPTREQYLEQAAEVQKHLHLWRGECGHHWLKEESQDCPLCKLESLQEARDECERQFQENVAEIGGLLDRAQSAENRLETAEKRVKRLEAIEESLLDRADRAESRLEKCKAEIEEAGKAVLRQIRARRELLLLIHNDLWDRRLKHSDGTWVVNISNTIWRKLCEAVDAAYKPEVVESAPAVERPVTKEDLSPEYADRLKALWSKPTNGRK